MSNLKPSHFRNMYEALKMTQNNLENSLKQVEHSIERFESTAEASKEKLVRDNMPQISLESPKYGTPMVYRVACEEEMITLLANKLIEEAEEVCGEFCLDGSRGKLMEELADLQEVILAIQGLCDITSEEVERTRQNKANHRGRFDKRIVWDGKR